MPEIPPNEDRRARTSVRQENRQRLVLPFVTAALLALMFGWSQNSLAFQADNPKPSSESQQAKEQADKVFGTAEQKQKVWTAVLSQIADREHTVLFVAITPDRIAPNLSYTKPGGATAMKALARAIQREWKQIDGVQTFAYTDVLGDFAKERAAALNWIESLTNAQFKDLLEGKLSISQVEGPNQDVLRWLGGWDEDMSAVLLDKEDRIKLRLMVDPKIEYTDPKTGRHVSETLDLRPPPPAFTEADNNHGKMLESLDRPQVGDLDFGQGAVLTLAKIVEKASQAFRVRYRMDERLAGTLYFICGRLTQTAFENALAQMTKIPPVTPVVARKTDRSSDLALLSARARGLGSAKIDVTQLRDSLNIQNSQQLQQLNEQFGATEELDAGDCLQGQTLSASNLSEGKPGLAAYLNGLGIPPDGMVTLSAAFVLAIESDGEHATPAAFASSNGQAVPISSPNQTLILLLQ